MRANTVFITAALALVILLGLTGCRSSNSDPGSGSRGPVINLVEITQGIAANGLVDLTMSVYWNGSGACTIAINAGGNEVPTGTSLDGSPYTWVFTANTETTYNYTVIVTDAYGYEYTATGTYSYTAPPPPNDAPVIESVDYYDYLGILQVLVSDTEGDDVTIEVSDIEGMVVDGNTKTITAGAGAAEFNWALASGATSSSGETTISVYDERHSGAPVTTTQEITILFWEPTESVLAAIPMESSAVVGETVTIQVTSGDFPAGGAFNYMNSVGVTVNDGGDYVDGTFNVGSIGGEQKGVDGIWADMNPAPEGFFIPQDFMMKATDVTADPSLDYLHFNVTPLGAGEVSNGGDLFNFGVAFNHPGTYRLGFLEYQDVKRTYYSDNAAVEYNWDNLDNYFGIPNFVVVTAE